MSRLFKKYCQALQSLIEASAEVKVSLNGDIFDAISVKAHYEQSHKWIDVTFFN